MVSPTSTPYHSRKHDAEVQLYAFDDPIPSPGGGQLRTLRDAANYIIKLPKRVPRCAGMARGD